MNFSGYHIYMNTNNIYRDFQIFISVPLIKKCLWIGSLIINQISIWLGNAILPLIIYTLPLLLFTILFLNIFHSLSLIMQRDLYKADTICEWKKYPLYGDVDFTEISHKKKYLVTGVSQGSSSWRFPWDKERTS